MLPKWNLDYITLPLRNLSLHSVKPKLTIWLQPRFSLPSYHSLPHLCCSGLTVLLVPQTGLSCHRTLSSLLLLTRAQPYNPHPTHSLVLFLYLPTVTSSERFPWTQSGTQPPWPLTILSALTLRDFSSQHFHH